MPALDQSRRWTREEVLALPDDGKRYELVDGELPVSPRPRPLHERAVDELHHVLSTYVRAHRLGRLYSSRADLVIEVLSPSSEDSDRVTKRVRYQRSGVPLYWIVDIDARRVEVWTPEADRPVIVSDVLIWRPSPAVPALEIDLPALFTAVEEA